MYQSTRQIMKKILSLLLLSFIFTQCDNDSGSGTQTRADLLQGNWRVTVATIDESSLPVAGTPFELIRIRFEGNQYRYIFPKVDENNNLVNPLVADTIAGSWQLNADQTKILLDRTSLSMPVFEWDIIELRIGVFRSRYVGPRAGSTTETSVYEMSYTLSAN